MYLLSGQGGEWDSQHLIREYNRNINSLYKSWTPTEPNATGLFIEPYNAGFSYQGTGDFRDYKWDTYSLQYDGVDEYVTVGDVGLSQSAGTISLWVNAQNWDNYDNPFDTSSAVINAGIRADFYGGGTPVLFVVYAKDGGGTTSAALDASAFDDQWGHMVITWSGSTIKGYTNGVESFSNTDLYTSFVVDSLIIGAGFWWNSTYRFFEGLIDEMAAWDSALSAVQIRAIYNGGTPESLTPYSPTAWWRMGDGPLDDGSADLIGDQMNPTLGSDLITNGNFTTDSDWIKGDGWSISDGVASSDGSQSGGSNLKQVAGLATGNVAYEVTFTVSDYSAGNVRTVLGGSAVGTFRSANGTYTQTLWIAGGSNFFIQSDADFVGSIDNVVVKKVNGSAGQMINMEASDIVADAPISNKWDVYSVDFDGVDDYVDAGTGLGDALGDNYAGSLTVSLWFKADVTSASDGLFDISNFVSSTGPLTIILQGDNIKLRLNDAAWARSVAFTDTASWHHLACVYATGSEADSKMYLDGVAVGTTAGTFPSSADMDFAGLKTIIGSYYHPIYPLNGKMDEVAFFASALSAAQVLTIYNGGVPADLSSLSPDAWWRMGDGDYYPTLQDSSGNDYDGTMTNMESSDIRADTP